MSEYHSVREVQGMVWQDVTFDHFLSCFAMILVIYNYASSGSHANTAKRIIILSQAVRNLPLDIIICRKTPLE